MQQVFMFIQVYVASVVSGLFKLFSPDLGWWHNTTVANSKLNLSVGTDILYLILS